MLRVPQALLMVDEDTTTVRRIAAGDTLRFSEGAYRFRIIHPSYLDRVVDARLSAGQDTVIRISFPGQATGEFASFTSWHPLKNRNNLYVETDDETEIWLDGEKLGTGHIWYDMPVDSLPHVLRLVHKSYHVTNHEFSFHPRRSMHVVDYLLPDRRVSHVLSLLPGGTQFYERDTRKGAVFAGVVTVGVLSGRFLTDRYQRKNNEYLLMRQRYQNAGEVEAEALGNKTDKLRSQASTMGLLRDVSYGAAAVMYVSSLVDALVPHPMGYRNVRIRPNPYPTVTVSF
jgi:hypothetical protein